MCEVLLDLGMCVASSHVMALGKWHVLAWNRVGLLHYWSLVGLSLMISILNFDLRKLILIQDSLLAAFQEAVQIRFRTFVIVL